MSRSEFLSLWPPFVGDIGWEHFQYLLNKADQDSQVDNLSKFWRPVCYIHYLVNNSDTKPLKRIRWSNTTMAVFGGDATRSTIQKLHNLDGKRLGISHGYVDYIIF